MSVYYNTSSSKRRSNQIKIVLHSIARPTGKKSSVQRKEMQRKETASPMMTFFSGPGFEARELELDLRDLVGVNINDLDDSLKDILLDDPKRPGSTADTDDIDNVSIVSEVSTCSSAVTVTLEPVDEEPRSPRHKPPSSPIPYKTAEPWSCPSSSEAEEEDTRKTGRKSKKISNLFSFNSGSANPNSGHSETQQLERSSSERRKRRSSLTKLMSPLALSIFTASGLPSAPINVAEMRPDLYAEKESKRSSSQSKGSRKLSLTMFQKQSSSDKLNETKKRRNTDPNLMQKLKTSTIAESESEGLKAESEEANQERVRKVSFNSLAPSVQDLTESNLRVEPEEASFKEEDIRLRDVMGKVLRSHLLSMVDYKRETCDRTGKSISKIIKTIVESIKESEGLPSKVACLVYIAAVRDEGIFMSTQALWDSNQDNFAAASFRNDSVFGLAVVIATPYI